MVKCRLVECYKLLWLMGRMRISVTHRYGYNDSNKGQASL